ncbi:MAG: hypothetical protein H6779_04515 [Candidatus Nomurabacteria bacterium]|nr:hypothetical protein [Candidatus Nomurabacteria bacterium]USN87640.1 MAG: hypothetical protein H6779_04515 [Candidatus Nomurabacteria bacterium]
MSLKHRIIFKPIVVSVAANSFLFAGAVDAEVAVAVISEEGFFVYGGTFLVIYFSIL